MRPHSDTLYCWTEINSKPKSFLLLTLPEIKRNWVRSGQLGHQQTLLWDASIPSGGFTGYTTALASTCSLLWKFYSRSYASVSLWKLLCVAILPSTLSSHQLILKKHVCIPSLEISFQFISVFVVFIDNHCVFKVALQNLKAISRDWHCDTIE